MLPMPALQGRWSKAPSNSPKGEDSGISELNFQFLIFNFEYGCNHLSENILLK